MGHRAASRAQHSGRAEGRRKRVHTAQPESRSDLPREPRRGFWTPSLLALIVIGTLLRLYYLGQPMRYDESVTYLYFAAGSWGHAISSYTYPNNHVFHTLLVKVCVALFGNDPRVIRLPAIAAGIATIPLTFWVGRRLFGSAAAYVAAALVATSGALVLYSTNARGYTMICAASLALAALLLRLRDRSSARLWMATIIVTSLGLWTIPVMVFPAGGLALWFVLSAVRDETTGGRANVKSMAGAVAATAVVTTLLYSPIIAHSGIDALVGNSFVRASPWSAFIVQLPSSIKPTVAGWTLGLPLAGSALVAACAFVGLLNERRTSGMRVSMAGSMYVWCALVLLLTHRDPFPRVWMFLVAPAALLSAHGLIQLLSDFASIRDRLVSRAEEASIALAIVLASILVFSRAVVRSRDTGTLRDAHTIASAFARTLRPGDRVIAPLPSNAPLAYYFVRQGVDTSYLSSAPDSSSSIFLVVNTDEGFTINTRLAEPILKSVHGARLLARYASAEVYRLY